MKISIKRITLIVSILIAIIFSYQLYWLYGLYSSTLNKTEKAINEAMPSADHEELFRRIDNLKSIYKDSDDINISINADFEKENLEYKQDNKEEEDSCKISAIDNAGDIKTLDLNTKNAEILNGLLHKAIHSVVDTLFSIDLVYFDSVLVAQLQEKNILLDHQLVLIEDSTKSDENLKQVESVYSKHYNYYYSRNKRSMIRLYTKNPAVETLKQMIGILSTSVTIFFLLLYIFSYLIRIIRKLQTEEELKRNFTNNMTHELKTPIAVSYAAVDALLISDGPVPIERLQKYLNIAKNQMSQLSGLVEQILSMSRKDNRQIDLKKEDVDIENVISEITEKQKLVHKKEIKIDTDLDVKLINADKLHLTNIFNNLIENSIKYSEGSVHIFIQSKRVDNHIIISFKDNGIGIDPKYMPKLFDKFYRVPTGNKHTVKGYGLGLFYVKEMIVNHGGTIDVQSKTGKGTAFKIKMPQ